MEEPVKGLSDYLEIFRRRKKQLLLPIAILLILTVTVAISLPPVYRSEAIILIEQQEIPQELVPSTVTSYADQRIQVISQRVMTRANLLGIINKFDLYAEQRETQTLESMLDRMRKDINLKMVSADVVDPRSGRPMEATIAFTLSYDSKSPDLAQKVANELVSLYLNENLKRRSLVAAETSSFLAEEAKSLSALISDLEAKLAAFKEKNVGRLPELVQLNLQLMERTERQLTETQNQIRSLEERKIYLESELAQLNPNAILMSADGERILGPEDRLKSLRAQHVSMAAFYAQNHPDLVRMRKEIEALRTEVGGSADTTELERQLKSLQAELAAARDRYSAEHPDVKKLEREVTTLTEEAKKAAVAPKLGLLPNSKPDNPAYIQLQAQLQAANTELQALERTEQELTAKVTAYEERLTQTPQVEREYRTLTRDYENALAKYSEIKAKQMQAQLAETMEKESKGERFSLIEPPLLPEEPEKPNRMVIVLVGMVLSFAGGIGTAAATENMDRTVHGAKGVVALLHAPPLAVIPYIKNKTDMRRRIARRLTVTLLVALAVAGGAALVHFLFMPLDVLWFAALRRFGLLQHTLGR